MSKLRRSAPVGGHSRSRDKNGSAKERYLQRAGQRGRLTETLTNIVEEDQEPEDRDFNMDDAYLSECLQILDKNTKPEVEAHDYGEVEEYDFDDFLSIASTASFTNLVFESNDEVSPEVLQAPLSRVPVLEPVRSRLLQEGVVNAAKRETPVAGREPAQTPQRGEIPRSVIKSRAEPTPGHEVNGAQVLLRGESPDQQELTVAEEEDDDMAGRATKTSALRAAENGDFITLQRLIDKYPDQTHEILLARDQRGNTPVHRASLCGQLECLKWLVSHVPEGSLSVRNRDDLTAAAGAAKYGHRECLQWLIEQTSASIELENHNASTSLLHHAAVSGQEECLRFLLNIMQSKDLPIDLVDQTGSTPVQLAAREGHLACVQTLVEFNADVTVKDKGGRTAADYSYLAGHSSCARYLIAVESCWLLSSRVARLHQELRESKEENQELKRKFEVLESRSVIPDRPDALGAHCQGDGSSSVDSLEGEQDNENSFVRVSKSSRPFNNVPDGESLNNSSSLSGSDKQVSSLLASRSLDRMQGSTDSPPGSGMLTPVSMGDGDVSEIQKVITKQMVAVTHRLMMNRHALNLDERASAATARPSPNQMFSPRALGSAGFQERKTAGSPSLLQARATRTQAEERVLTGGVQMREKKTKDFPQHYRWTYAGEKLQDEILTSNTTREKPASGQEDKLRTVDKTPHRTNNSKAKSSSSDSSMASQSRGDLHGHRKCSSSECSCEDDLHFIHYDLTPTHSRSSISSDCSSELTNDSPHSRRRAIMPQKPIVQILATEKPRQVSRPPPVARKPAAAVNGQERAQSKLLTAAPTNALPRVQNTQNNTDYSQPVRTVPLVDTKRTSRTNPEGRLQANTSSASQVLYHPPRQHQRSVTPERSKPPDSDRLSNTDTRVNGVITNSYEKNHRPTRHYMLPLKGDGSERKAGSGAREVTPTNAREHYTASKVAAPVEASKTSNTAKIVRLKDHEHAYVNGTTRDLSYSGKAPSLENGFFDDRNIYGEKDFINQPELSLGLRQSTLDKLESSSLPSLHFDDDFNGSKAWYED